MEKPEPILLFQCITYSQDREPGLQRLVYFDMYTDETIVLQSR